MGKVIYRELCKKLKSAHDNKWYKHESVQENKTIQIYEIQRSKQITISRLEVQAQRYLTKRKKKSLIPNKSSFKPDHQLKIKDSEKIYEYLDFARELNKLWNMR